MSSWSCRWAALPIRTGRTAVAFQMIERLFGEIGAAVDAVHELQGAGRVAVRFMPTVLQPILESRRFFGEADPQEAIQRERGITNPGVAVVPVAHAADRLRQAAGRGCDNRSGRLEREEFERQGGTLDDLTPAAVVGAMRQPTSPVFDRGAEEFLRLAQSRTTSVLLLRIKKPQDKRGLLSFLEDKVGDHAISVLLQPHRGSQAKTDVLSRKAGAVLIEVSLVRVARIIEARPTLQMKRHGAANDANAPDQLIRRRARAADRHVVLHFPHAIGMQESE